MTRHGACLVCPACGTLRAHGAWVSFWSPCCGAFHRSLWVSEHVDPKRAARMTMAQIRAEYEAADLPFGPPDAQRRRAMGRPGEWAKAA